MCTTVNERILHWESYENLKKSLYVTLLVPYLKPRHFSQHLVSQNIQGIWSSKTFSGNYKKKSSSSSHDVVRCLVSGSLGTQLSVISNNLYSLNPLIYRGQG